MTLLQVWPPGCSLGCTLEWFVCSSQ